MRVEWAEEALDQLTDIYVTLPLAGQDAMARLVERANQSLAATPDQLGESRKPWVRVWFVGELMIRYDISPAEQTVTVYEVSRVAPRKR